MKIFNLTYDSHEESAEEANEDAVNYARGTLFSEYTYSEQTPKNHHFVASVNGVNVYYQLVAGFFFFEPITE